MAEAGLEVSSQQVAEVEHVIDAGPKALARLLEVGAQVDGLVIAGEIWAAAVLLDLLRRGGRVPKDIALISIGEVELGPYLPVTMSYVSLPRYATGRAAAELALALSRGDEIGEPVIKLPVTLVRNESA